MRTSRYIAIVVLTAMATIAGSAAPANAGESVKVRGKGVTGVVRFKDGTVKSVSSLQAKVQDAASDSACAEVWMDFTTFPHEHFDAYAVRICGNGRSGWGRVNKQSDWRIHGFRTAACTWSSNGTRRCTQQWPHDAVRANTYNLQVL